jgi:hypothetical protein
MSMSYIIEERLSFASLINLWTWQDNTLLTGMVNVLITICTAQHQARSALCFVLLIEQLSDRAFHKKLSEALSTFYADMKEIPSASCEEATKTLCRGYIDTDAEIVRADLVDADTGGGGAEAAAAAAAEGDGEPAPAPASPGRQPAAARHSGRTPNNHTDCESVYV